MPEYCVVVMNGARARFFTLEPSDAPTVEGGPNLKEHTDLVNPDHETQQTALWSDNKSGRNRTSGGGTAAGGPAHGYDDHRTRHEDEFKRRFARAIAEEAARLVQSTKAENVVLAAQNRMLGILRPELDPLVKTGVQIHDVAKDLSKMSAHEIHQHLANDKLVPPRRNPAA